MLALCENFYLRPEIKKTLSRSPREEIAVPELRSQIPAELYPGAAHEERAHERVQVLLRVLREKVYST